MAYDAMSDTELLHLFIQGNEPAFAQLFWRYEPTVKAFIFRYVHSEAIAEDLTQEVFIKLWDTRGKLSEVQSFKSYLMVMSRNYTLNSLRTIFRSEVAMGEVIQHYTNHRNPTEDGLLDKDYHAFLQKILDSLPARTREIFRQCRENRRSYEEVANELGISKNAVKNHMVYSMKVLKTSVEKELGVSLTILLAIIFRR